MPKLHISDGETEAIILDIYRGVVTVNNLPKDLYLKTANSLLRALYSGFGAYISYDNKAQNKKFIHKAPTKSISFGEPDYELLNELRLNVYMFSGAKTYQQYKAINGLITEGNELLTYKVFKEKALAEFKIYNEDWLKSEFETAVTSAQTAKEYKHIQDNIDSFPMTRYSAVGGERECEICGALHNVTLKSNDPFWAKNSPPRHFNCMCLLESIDKYDAPHTAITPPHRIEALEKQAKEKVNPVFMMNAAIDGYIFSPKHPYFKIEKQDKKLAERNFNLPIPKKDA